MKPEVDPPLDRREKSARLRFEPGLPVVVQVWMTSVLLFFIVIRVVGSNTVQNFLHQLGAH